MLSTCWPSARLPAVLLQGQFAHEVLDRPEARRDILEIETEAQPVRALEPVTAAVILHQFYERDRINPAVIAK